MNQTKRIWVLTLFPDYFLPFQQWGVTGKVLSGKRPLNSGQNLELKLVRMGDFCTKGHKGLDDAPFGGGPGMLLRADRLKEVLELGVIGPGNYDLERWPEQLTVIYTSARGTRWDQSQAQKMAQEFFLSGQKDLVFLCGRYEGVDERFLQKYVDYEFCIGDYILSGGELAVMVCLDSMVRLLEGTLGDETSLHEESFGTGLIEGPQYTRPQDFEGIVVPPIYLSGHEAKIEAFKREQSMLATQKWRPDLLEQQP